MSQAEIARNYAEALFRTGQEDEASARIEEELEALTDLTQRTELGRFWHNPLVPKAEKRELADALTAEYHPYLRNTVRIMIKRNRIDLLSLLFREFVRVRDRLGGALRVVVFTPMALTKAQLDKIVNRVEDLSDRQVRLSVVEDPTLVGGIRLRLHDRVLDGTVTARLARLRKSLISTAEG